MGTSASGGALPDAHAVLEALPFGALVVQRDNTVSGCNRRAHTLFEIELGAVGRKFSELRLSAENPHLQAAVDDVNARGQPVRIADVNLESDGVDRSFSFVVTPVFGAGGLPQGALVLAEEDRAEHRRLVDELEAAQRTDLQKDNFLAMLAHELRNPLGPILNALYVIRRAVSGDAQAKSALAIADRQVRQQSRLLDDLLDVSRIIHGRIDLRRQPVDFVEVVNLALEASSFDFRTRAHRVETH